MAPARRLLVAQPGLLCRHVRRGAVGRPVWRTIAAVTLPFGLLLGLTALSALPARGLLRTRFVAAFAFVFGVGLPFVYYLGFVYRYPIDPAWLLVAAGCLFAGLLAFAVLRAFAPARGSHTARRSEEEPGPYLERRPGTPHARWITASAVAVVMFLLVASAFAGGDGRRQSAAGALPLRMASYNIFMGLGGDVDLDLDRLAEQIARQRPDVVALQEVSRGWFTSGSVDLLPRLAERLGYSYHFFPAAGDTWGNAILTNLPSREYAQGVLPRGTSAMQRGWGGALLELADGRDMLVVVSHLHHPANGQSLRAEQAAVLVEDTLSLADRHQVLPLTVVVGDLNAEADSEELSPLRSSFLDALAHRGDPLATYPSWAPRQRIDHIFVSSGLVGTEPAVFGGLASDHLGIAVSLAPAPLPDEGPALAVGSADEGAAPATGPADAGAAVEAAGTGAGGVDPPSDAFDAQAGPVSRR